MPGGYGDLDSRAPCTGCGGPREKGFIGIVTERCLSCARSDKQIPDCQPAAPGPEALLQPNMEAKEVASEHLDHRAPELAAASSNASTESTGQRMYAFSGRPADASDVAPSGAATESAVQQMQRKESDDGVPSSSEIEIKKVAGDSKELVGALAGSEVSKGPKVHANSSRVQTLPPSFHLHFRSFSLLGL